MGFSMGGGGLMGLAVRVRMGGRDGIELMHMNRFMMLTILSRLCLRMFGVKSTAQQ